MFVRIEVALRAQYRDLVGETILASLRREGLAQATGVRMARVYHFSGLTGRGGSDWRSAAASLGRTLLADPVAEKFAVDEPAVDKGFSGIVEVARKPGVMDPVEASLIKALSDAGCHADVIRTSKRYYLFGPASPVKAAAVARRILANEMIERIVVGGIERWEEHAPASHRHELVTVPILTASKSELMAISKRGMLSLNPDEMAAIQAHFKGLGRNPTDVELESLAQTWSEHCVHKTLKGVINFNGRIIDNLLASTIARATRELDKPWCVSVFRDNAGVIAFDDRFDVTFKVETHNHPSALEPYGGAGTGIGGVIRDTLGTGLGAKPILNTDVFCFGDPQMPDKDVPPGAQHPRRIMDGVVAGVRDYGNRMGIPTANGAVYFDERYTGNPLVYCGSVGIIPKGHAHKEVKPGDLVVLLGGRTGRDGIHGATFSSIELTHESEELSSGAVQIGNAIEEKKLADAILTARDRGLFRAITDCGAGGLSSAVGEMGEHTGVRVNLDVVPLKYEGLSYTEIWISEAQERMTLAVPPENRAALENICASERVEMTVIGEFTNTGRLELFFRGERVCDMDMAFLHGGLPRLHRTATHIPVRRPEPSPGRFDATDALLKILASPNVASKEWIIRQYDHEVQGTSVLKPLVGVTGDGPGDAAVIAPVYGSRKGLVVACGMNPRYGDLDAYRMAACGIDEALRQVIAVGGDIDQAALLDNYAWGDTRLPEQLGTLVMASQACYDYSMLFGTPFISGKDSLHNTFDTGHGVIHIPPTLLISSIAILDDIARTRTMDLKREGNALYIVGLTKREMGGSHLHSVLGLPPGGRVPEVDKGTAPKLFRAMGRANREGVFASIHDLSEGGLAVAAAEMAFAGMLGAEIALDKVPARGKHTTATLLFSESATRWLVEVTPDNEAKARRLLKGLPFARIGEVIPEPRLNVARSGREVLSCGLSELKSAWQKMTRNFGCNPK